MTRLAWQVPFVPGYSTRSFGSAPRGHWVLRASGLPLGRARVGPGPARIGPLVLVARGVLC